MCTRARLYHPLQFCEVPFVTCSDVEARSTASFLFRFSPSCPLLPNLKQRQNRHSQELSVNYIVLDTLSLFIVQFIIARDNTHVPYVVSWWYLCKIMVKPGSSCWPFYMPGYYSSTTYTSHWRNEGEICFLNVFVLQRASS